MEGCGDCFVDKISGSWPRIIGYFRGVRCSIIQFEGFRFDDGSISSVVLCEDSEVSITIAVRFCYYGIIVKGSREGACVWFGGFL